MEVYDGSLEILQGVTESLMILKDDAERKWSKREPIETVWLASFAEVLGVEDADETKPPEIEHPAASPKEEEIMIIEPVESAWFDKLVKALDDALSLYKAITKEEQVLRDIDNPVHNQLLQIMTTSIDKLLSKLEELSFQSDYLGLGAEDRMQRVIWPVFEVKLGGDDWDLVKRFANVAGIELPVTIPDMDITIGRRLQTMCGGSFEALEHVCAALSGSDDVDKWQSFAYGGNEIEEDEDIITLPSVLNCYALLPRELKRCVAYCSMFPKNYPLDKQKLLLQWSALGFLLNTGSADCTHIIFNGLAQKSPDDSVFVLHHKIHELVSVHNDKLCATSASCFTNHTRYFSYIQGKYDFFPQNNLQSMNACPLRVFMPLPSLSNNTPLCYLNYRNLEHLTRVVRHIKILSLANYQITELPSSISNLKMLHYLDLSNTLISSLPDSVCDLFKLQTLLLSECTFLTKLPDELWKLQDLFYLCIKGTRLTEMSFHSGRVFIVGRDSGLRIQDLKRQYHKSEMSKRRKRKRHNQIMGCLRISELQNITSQEDAEALSMKKWAVRELFLEWGSSQEKPEKYSGILGALEPFEHLPMLTMKNYLGVSFPDWLGNSAFVGLTSLHLYGCPNCTSLPSLGQLPFLKNLSIENFDRLEIIGQTFCGETLSERAPFESLKTLQFKGLQVWRTWSITDTAFPVLNDLELVDCPKLSGKLLIRPKCKLKLSNSEQVDLAMLADLPSLTSLDLGFNRDVASYAPDLQLLTSLKDLTISGCCNLPNFENLNYPPTLETLFISHSHHVLGGADLSSGSFYEMQPLPNALRRIPVSIKSLEIRGFKSVELSSLCYGSLNFLSFSDCHFKRPFYFPLNQFPLLECLRIRKCSELQSFDSIPPPGCEQAGLSFLNELSIENSSDFMYFPREGLLAPNLKTLSITNCSNLLCLPEGMSTSLASLQSLSLENCPEIESFPDGGLSPSLQTLRIRYCNKLMSNWDEWHLESLVSLKKLEIYGIQEMECFPEDDWLPKSIESIVIAHFPNLTYLIGEELVRLTSLQELKFIQCPKIRSLPPQGVPASLRFLGIHFCPRLKEWWRKNEGQKWSKISHLVRINIDLKDM